MRCGMHGTRAVLTATKSCNRKAKERFAVNAMMGRIGKPEDIANAIAFLASPESGWITAQMLTVDGGRMDYIGHG
jgi:NAD(P)-dependent dehydrogenase (short-subunit alcohol dehydrogenase family)